jgi:peptidoglycan/LPS O-acetylase OafA/YrhL
LLPQVFLMQAWFVPGPSGWNMPTWTLSALIVCYAGFPAAWRATAKIASPWTPWRSAWRSSWPSTTRPRP